MINNGEALTGSAALQTTRCISSRNSQSCGFIDCVCGMGMVGGEGGGEWEGALVR